MDLVVLPQLLLIAYGFLVLGCGAALGAIVTRNLQRRLEPTEPPPLLERRIHVLEQELEAMRSEVSQLADENDFLRQLAAPDDERVDPSHLGVRFIA